MTLIGLTGMPRGYELETNALLARFTSEPSAQRKRLIDDLVAALKTAGIWSKLDALYVMAAHDSQAGRRNWIADQFNLTAVASPTFATDRGYTTNGSSSYLNTNLEPASASQFAQNSSHLGLHSRTSGQAAGADMGARISSSSRQSVLLIRGTADNFNSRLNVDTNPANITSTDGSGHFIGVRRESANVYGFRNGSLAGGPISRASAAPCAFAMTIGAVNTNGTVGAFNAREYSAAHVGAALSDAEVLAFNAALNTYLVAVGAA